MLPDNPKICLFHYLQLQSINFSELRMSPIHIQNTPAFYHNGQQEDRPKVRLYINKVNVSVNLLVICVYVCFDRVKVPRVKEEDCHTISSKVLLRRKRVGRIADLKDSRCRIITIIDESKFFIFLLFHKIVHGMKSLL